MSKQEKILENQRPDLSTANQLSSPAAQNTLVGVPSEKKGFKSIGYIVHNELTYRVVDFLLNSTIGVALTYWSQRTHSGQKYFAQPVSNFFKGIIRTFSSNAHTVETGAKWGSMFTSIIVGGTAIIPPMTILEHKKIKHAMVRSIDEMVYGKDTVENDPKFAELHDSIEHEPKKDFWTGMAARIAVLVPMLAATITPKAHKVLEEQVYDRIGSVTKFASGSVGIKAPKMKARIKDGISDWDFVHKTIGFDFGLTFIYSFLHEYAFKGFSKLRRDHEEVEEIVATTLNIPLPEGHTTDGHKEHYVERAKKPASYTEQVSGAQPSYGMGAA